MLAAALLLLHSPFSFNVGLAGIQGGHAVSLSRSPVTFTMSIQEDIKDRIRSAMKGGPDRKAELQVSEPRRRRRKRGRHTEQEKLFWHRTPRTGLLTAT
jgi:hypothetical protein